MRIDSPTRKIPVAPAFAALLAGFVLACVLWLWWPKPDSRSAYRLLSVTGIVCAVVFALLNAPIPYGGCEIVALDVGQGDAILIRSGKHSGASGHRQSRRLAPSSVGAASYRPS